MNDDIAGLLILWNVYLLLRVAYLRGRVRRVEGMLKKWRVTVLMP